MLLYYLHQLLQFSLIGWWLRLQNTGHAKFGTHTHHHTCTQLITLDEIGIEYKNQYIDLPLKNIHPNFASKNIKMLIPALEVCSKIDQKKTFITDSRDIANFAVTLPGGARLVPKGKEKEVCVLVCVSIFACVFTYVCVYLIIYSCADWSPWNDWMHHSQSD